MDKEQTPITSNAEIHGNNGDAAAGQPVETPAAIELNLASAMQEPVQSQKTTYEGQTEMMSLPVVEPLSGTVKEQNDMVSLPVVEPLSGTVKEQTEMVSLPVVEPLTVSERQNEMMYLPVLEPLSGAVGGDKSAYASVYAPSEHASVISVQQEGGSEVEDQAQN